MRLKQALEASVRRLETGAVGSPRMNAEVLLMFTLACDRAYLYAHPERELTSPELLRYHEAVEERVRGVPSQYITGHQEFWGLDLIVTPAVLIPRPETEHAVETVLDLVRTAPPALTPAAIRIVDIGTGSGCIAFALATELPTAEVWATDISDSALEIARANAARLQLTKRVRFVQSDLLYGLAAAPQCSAGLPAGSPPPQHAQNRHVPGTPPAGVHARSSADHTNLFADPSRLSFDFVVSNPPYVGESEADQVQREVRKFEPKAAVFAGLDGLDVIAQLIPQAHACLSPGGWLVMEIGHSQEQSVRVLLKDWAEVRTVPDLQGIPRVLAARKS